MNALGRWLISLAMAGVLAVPSAALAQGDTDTSPTSERPDPPASYDRLDAKAVGISGGAIAGFELIAAAEALFKIKKAWPYLTFPFVGAAGGAVGGYFLEKASPEGAVALLVGSLALVIPTAVLVSVARAYDPASENAVEDENTGKRYSFETAPKKGGAASGESTSTEVEASPDAQGEDSPSPPDEAPVAPPKEGNGAAGPSAKIEEGQLRAARAGALLYFDTRSGFATMAMPSIALLSRDRGPSFSGENSRHVSLEVMVPVLHIDLP